MPYATPDDLTRVVGAARLQRLLPELQAESLTARLTEAIEAGAAKIDAAIGHVYATPLALSSIADADQRTSSTVQVRRVCLFLALEYLTLGVEKLPAGITAGIKSADDWLRSVAERRAKIPGLTSESRPAFAAFGPVTQTAVNPLDDDIFEAYAFV